MSEWIRRMFIERADLFLRVLNKKWAEAERLVGGMLKLLSSYGITSGNLLDLCCGNGRISIHMAKRGFRAVGVDISGPLIEDAVKKAVEHGVADRVKFVLGDVRRLKEVLGGVVTEPFDVVVNAWTSIGYFPEEEDYSVFRQARELSKSGAVLFILDTVHSEYISLKYTPTAYIEAEDLVVLERREYDPLTSTIHGTQTYYVKRGKDLVYADKVDYQVHVYSLSELARLLERAGWRPVAYYGDIESLHPMTPLTVMNVVAVAL